MAATNGTSTSRQLQTYRRYYKAHGDTIRKRSSAARKVLKYAAMQAYGGYWCMCQHGEWTCGESTPQFLSIDHINGGGNQHRKKVGGGATFHLWLKQNNYPPGYRILCYNCNLSSGFHGHCPKEGKG